MFVIRRRTPTQDDLKAYAKAFRERCPHWQNYLGDYIYMTSEGDEEDSESLTEELGKARSTGLVSILRRHGALPEELCFVMHPSTGGCLSAPIYTAIRQVSLEGRGSVLAEAFHGAEVHLLDSEGAIILVAPGDYAPRLGLRETLFIDCNSHYDTQVKGRPYDESHVEIVGYALADREVEHSFMTLPGRDYSIRRQGSMGPDTPVRGNGKPHAVRGVMQPGRYHVSLKEIESSFDFGEEWTVVSGFHAGLRWKDMEDFTIQYNSFPFLDGRDDWFAEPEGPSRQERIATHLKNWRNEGYVEEVYRHKPLDFPFLPLQVRSDPEWVTRFCSRRAVNFLGASDSVRNDRDFAIQLISAGDRPGAAIYPYLPSNLRRDLDVLKAMHAAGRLFSLPDPDDVSFLKYEDIRSFVAANLDRIREVLDIFPNILRFAPTEVFADRHIVLAALANDKGLLASLPANLCDDEEVILAACGKYDPSLRHASERLRKDPLFVRRMLEICGRNIEYAEEWMKRDRSFVLAAAHAGSRILEHVPADFTDDEEVMLQVIGENGFSLKDASERLRTDKGFILKALDMGLYYTAIEGPLAGDRDVVLRAMQVHPHEFKEIPAVFRGDREIALAVLSRKGGYGRYIEYCSEALRDDPDIVISALLDTAGNLRYASERLKGDIDFLGHAVMINPDCLDVIPEPLCSDPALLQAYEIGARRR
jgi:hypothetical protein